MKILAIAMLMVLLAGCGTVQTVGVWDKANDGAVRSAESAAGNIK